MTKKLVSVFLCFMLALMPLMSLAEDGRQVGEIVLGALNEGRRIEISLDAGISKAVKKILGKKASGFADKLGLEFGFQLGDTLRTDTKLTLDNKVLYSGAFEAQDDAAYLWSNIHGDKVYAFAPGEVFGVADEIYDALDAVGLTKGYGKSTGITKLLSSLGNTGLLVDDEGGFPTSIAELQEILGTAGLGYDFSNVLAALGALIPKVKLEELDKPVDPLRYVTAFSHAHVLPEGVSFKDFKTDKASKVAYVLKANISNDDVIGLLNALIADIKKEQKEYSDYLDIANGIIGSLIPSFLKNGIDVEVYLDKKGGFVGTNVSAELYDYIAGQVQPFVSFMMPSVDGVPLLEAKAGLIGPEGNSVPFAEFAALLDPEHYAVVFNIGTADVCILELLVNTEGSFVDGKGRVNAVLHCPLLFGENTLLGTLDIKGKVKGNSFDYKTDGELSVADGSGSRTPLFNVKIGAKTVNPVKPLDPSKHEIVNVGELSGNALKSEIEKALGDIYGVLGDSFGLFPASMA